MGECGWRRYRLVSFSLTSGRKIYNSHRTYPWRGLRIRKYLFCNWIATTPNFSFIAWFSKSLNSLVKQQIYVITLKEIIYLLKINYWKNRFQNNIESGTNDSLRLFGNPFRNFKFPSESNLLVKLLNPSNLNESTYDVPKHN